MVYGYSLLQLPNTLRPLCPATHTLQQVLHRTTQYYTSTTKDGIILHQYYTGATGTGQYYTVLQVLFLDCFAFTLAGCAVLFRSNFAPEHFAWFCGEVCVLFMQVHQLFHPQPQI